MLPHLLILMFILFAACLGKKQALKPSILKPSDEEAGTDGTGQSTGWGSVVGYDCGLIARGGGGGGGGNSHMKWMGMLVVSLRGVNFGFWSCLGCSGQNVIIFSCQGLV